MQLIKLAAMTRTIAHVNKREAHISAHAGATILLLSALVLTGCSGAFGGGANADVVAQKVTAQEFSLCSWVGAALSRSETPITVMVESTYVGDDPVESSGLVAWASGSETYGEENGSQWAECKATGIATDPSYGDTLTGGLTVRLRVASSPFKDPDSPLEADSVKEEYAGRVIYPNSFLSGALATLDDNLHLDITGEYGSDEAQLSLLKLLIDTWNDGTVEKVQSDNVSTDGRGLD